MANEKIKFVTGSLDNLPAAFIPGQVLFAIDSFNNGYIYFDKDASTRILMGNGAVSSFSPSTYLTNIKGAKDSGETNYILTGINGNGGDITTTASVPITLVSSSNKASTKLYLLGATSQTTKGVAGYSNSAVFINTSDQLEATSGFKGNLIGNVTGDVTGNVSGTAGSVAWANVSGHPTQVVQGGAGTVSAANYSIQLYDMNGATIAENTSDSTVNGVIKVPIDRVGSTNKTGTKLFIIGTTSQANTAQGYSNSGIYITTDNKIHGDLEGKADTAGTADTANAVTWSNVSGKPGQFIQGAGGTTGNTTYTIQLYDTDGQAVPTNSTSALNGVLTIPIAKISSAAATNTKLFLVGATSQTGYASDGRSHVKYYIDTDNKLHGTTFVGALEGNADTATSATSAEKDGSNNIITNTYYSTAAISGHTLTLTRPNGSKTDLTLPDDNTDTKVNMKARGTTKAYLLATSTAPASSNKAVESLAETGVYLDTTAATLVATTFKGALEGNADTATNATNDSAGNPINTTYIKDITISNHTLTFTTGDGSTTNHDRALNYVRLSGDTMTGALLPVGKNNFIAYPSDGSMDLHGNQTGYIRIKIPKTKSATMFSFDVTIYNYSTDRSVCYHIAGYNYTNASWNSTTAYCIAPLSNARADLPVRFLSNDNDLMYVCIGNTDTTWSYPKAIVHNITIQHSTANATNYTNWASGWTVDLINTAFVATEVKRTVEHTNISWTANSATSDGSNNIITNTYLSDVTEAANGLNYKLTFARPNNASAVIINVPQNTVGNKKVTTKLYWVGVASTSTTDTVATTNTDAAIYATNGVLTATKFVGNLEGNVTGTAGAVAWSNITGKPSQIVQGGAGTTATTKYTIQLYDINGQAIPTNATNASNGVIEIPAATGSIAGLVTTGTQTMAGAKTFSTSISTPQLTVTGASKFEYSGIGAGTDNVDRVIWFAYNGKNGIPVYDNDFKYNPATNTLTVANINMSGKLYINNGGDSTHSIDSNATLRITGGVSVSKRLSAKVVRIDNGETATTKGFNLIYDTTQECLKFQFGN